MKFSGLPKEAVPSRHTHSRLVALLPAKQMEPVYRIPGASQTGTCSFDSISRLWLLWYLPKFQAFSSPPSLHRKHARLYRFTYFQHVTVDVQCLQPALRPGPVPAASCGPDRSQPSPAIRGMYRPVRRPCHLNVDTTH